MPFDPTVVAIVRISPDLPLAPASGPANAAEVVVGSCEGTCLPLDFVGAAAKPLIDALSRDHDVHRGGVRTPSAGAAATAAATGKAPASSSSSAPAGAAAPASAGAGSSSSSAGAAAGASAASSSEAGAGTSASGASAGTAADGSTSTAAGGASSAGTSGTGTGAAAGGATGSAADSAADSTGSTGASMGSGSATGSSTGSGTSGAVGAGVSVDFSPGLGGAAQHTIGQGIARAQNQQPQRRRDVICDLFHYGHATFFQRARALGDELIVGVIGDDIGEYKPKPILDVRERAAVLESCRFVDRVIVGAPLYTDCAYLDSIGADFLCHGDDLAPELVAKYYPGVGAAGRLRMVAYTSAISTTQIVRRIAERLRDGSLDAKLSGGASPAEAAG